MGSATADGTHDLSVGVRVDVERTLSPGRRVAGDRRASGNVLEPVVHGQALLLGDRDHLVRALRWPAGAQHAVAVLEQALGDRMEDLLERGVADARGSSELAQRQRIARNSTARTRQVHRRATEKGR